MRASLSLAIAFILSTAQAVFGGQAEYLGSFTWGSSHPDFGGLSALEIVEDGNALIALSDRGFLVTARLSRAGPDQIINSMQLVDIAPLTDSAGQILPKFESDSEGLALASDGKLFISFEAVHGIGKFDLSGGMISDGLLRHPDFRSMQPNSSLEPLAMDATGRLCTAPERSGRLQRPFPVYCLDREGWSQPFAIPRSEDYLLSGMDFGPDGRLYVLERALRGIFFSTRVRSFAVDANSLSDARLLVQTPGGTHDNLEGISVWQDAAGDLRLALISDDNFNLFQRTEIVEYRLP